MPENHDRHHRCTTRRRVWRAASVAVPIVLLAAACGSGDDSGAANAGASSGGPGAAASVPAAIASLFPGTKATGTPVKIGLINPEGGASVDQPENRETAEAAVKYANAELGGIAGQRVLLAKGASTEPAGAPRDCAQRMLTNGVVAVVVATTAFGEQMAPVITGAGIPYYEISGASTSELTSPNAFMLTSGFPGVLVAMAKYSAGAGYKKVAAVVTDAPSVVGGVKAAGVPAFKGAGIDLTTVPIPPGTADATPQLQAGLASDPDAMMVVGDATMCSGVLKAKATIGNTAQTMIIQPCVDSATLSVVGARGLDAMKLFSDTAVTGTDPESQLFQTVMREYSPKTKTSGYAPVGYQGVLGMIRLVSGLTGDVTPASMISATKAAKDVPVPAAAGMTMTCDGQQFPGLSAVCSTPAVLSDIKNGVPTDPQVVK
jgi:branched-chain amino acid transport system substrate-binding protein